ncbi:hypothetical protein D3C71_1962520 [compost metagenome]
MMFSTIQPMGSKPVRPPSKAARPAMSAGMPYTAIAMMMAHSRPAPAAICALRCKKPKPTSMTTTGSAASKVESTILPRGL